MRRLRASILRRHKGQLDPVDFCFAVDDTANPKVVLMINAVMFVVESGTGFSGRSLADE